MSFDLIAKIMSENKLKYSIFCDQKPNPMSEALVLAEKLWLKFLILIFIQI